MKKHTTMNTLYPLAIFLALSLVSCKKGEKTADAYGNFEADEVIVSAQAQGILLSLDAEEGTIPAKDQVIGKIDSTTLVLKRKQLAAQQSVIRGRLKNVQDQLQVQEQQRINLAREVDRTKNLMKDGAATSQQYDDIAGKLHVLDSQTETIRSQMAIIEGDKSVLQAQIAEVNDQIGKCLIINPISGTVLEKYSEPGELVSPGKSLYKIADIRTLELKVYVSGEQLPSIVLGDSVDVQFDNPKGGLQKLPGIISWIASQVEFTPKIIQTREERVNMVYAVKIRVQNDGRLKIGMPGEVVFRKMIKTSSK